MVRKLRNREGRSYTNTGRLLIATGGGIQSTRLPLQDRMSVRRTHSVGEAVNHPTIGSLLGQLSLESVLRVGMRHAAQIGMKRRLESSDGSDYESESYGSDDDYDNTIYATVQIVNQWQPPEKINTEKLEECMRIYKLDQDMFSSLNEDATLAILNNMLTNEKEKHMSQNSWTLNDNVVNAVQKFRYVYLLCKLADAPTDKIDNEEKLYIFLLELKENGIVDVAFSSREVFDKIIFQTQAVGIKQQLKKIYKETLINAIKEATTTYIKYSIDLDQLLEGEPKYISDSVLYKGQQKRYYDMLNALGDKNMVERDVLFRGLTERQKKALREGMTKANDLLINKMKHQAP